MSQSEKMAALLGRDVKEDAQRQREESEKLRAEAAAQKTKERRFAALGVFVGLFFAIIEAYVARLRTNCFEGLAPWLGCIEIGGGSRFFSC